jgi:hypothetical protein
MRALLASAPPSASRLSPQLHQEVRASRGGFPSSKTAIALAEDHDRGRGSTSISAQEFAFFAQ